MGIMCDYNKKRKDINNSCSGNQIGLQTENKIYNKEKEQKKKN
jgi:hypothetical protein